MTCSTTKVATVSLLSQTTRNTSLSYSSCFVIRCFCFDCTEERSRQKTVSSAIHMGVRVNMVTEYGLASPPFVCERNKVLQSRIVRSRLNWANQFPTVKSSNMIDYFQQNQNQSSYGSALVTNHAKHITTTHRPPAPGLPALLFASLPLLSICCDL